MSLRSKVSRALTPGGIALLALSCASAKPYADQAGRAAVDALLPVAEENKLGRQLSSELEKEVQLIEQGLIVDYVRAMGGKVAAAAKDKPKGITLRFKVIRDDETVNAFAMPGGHIYVYTGLLKQLDDEAELMAVLAHEVAHVTHRHVAQNLIAMYGIEAVAQMALGEKPDVIGQLIKGIAANGFLLKYSRDHERESDLAGIGYEIKAGYDPQGFVTFFQKLDSGMPALLAIISTHPAPQERIENARRVIRAAGAVPSERGEAAYRDIRAQL